MSRWMRALEVLTNISVLVLCCGVGFLIIRNTYLVKPPSPPISSSFIGTKLSIPGVDWAVQDKTIVLALSTQCHFCSESSPFYARLAKAAKEKHTRIVGVFPQSIEDSREYLLSKNLQLDQVISAPLSDVHVNGTPTVFVVDRSGKISGNWVGKLQSDKEKDVLATL